MLTKETYRQRGWNNRGVGRIWKLKFDSLKIKNIKIIAASSTKRNVRNFSEIWTVKHHR